MTNYLFVISQPFVYMEYSIAEDKKLNSKIMSEGFRYVQARECQGSIYLKCALFRTNSCPCIGRINKATDLRPLYARGAS